MKAYEAKRLRLLVVDDERAIRELLKLQLTACDYEVVLAEDAFAAQRLLYEAPPDVMIVDAHLPYLSGMDFVSALVAEPSLPSVPVIFITGRHELLERAAALGAACLAKPFLVERLVELVERIAGERHRERRRPATSNPGACRAPDLATAKN